MRQRTQAGLIAPAHRARITASGDQVYKPLRIAPGETAVTVKSAVKQPGAEPMPFNYDVEKTTAGWKVCGIKKHVGDQLLGQL